MGNNRIYYTFLLLVATILAPTVNAYSQAVPDTLKGNLYKQDSLKDAAHPPLPAEGPKILPLDSVKTSMDIDSTKKILVRKKFQPVPKRAGLFSAILPGLGQLYNRQYWKIPVIYAGLGVAGYFIVTNQKSYQEYRKAYIGRLTGDLSNETTNTLLYTSDQLKTLQDGYKRYLDITVLITGVGYTLQILDAVVFAHLKNFDITEDISMRMKPLAMPNGGTGLGLVFDLNPKNVHKNFAIPF
ncbi:MAG: hypothetical protein BGO69_05045 [Bacteroidetes bacterium 46-16]|nr:MAG: hypothetical protein BGO69_05045 [Bacteroidetes bacterium 46-16]